jgi:urease subunit alpha
MTTLVGMGSGPTWDVGVNPGWILRRMEEALAEYPVNAVYLARGSSSRPEPLERVLAAGAGGLKVHEDTGGGPAVLDSALRVADAHDVAVAVHFDGMGETGELSDLLRAIDGRTVHAYHVEGAGGGPPDLLEVVQEPNVLPSSTTPTIPFGANALAEHADMIATSHMLHADLEGDARAARIRLRAGTMAAEEHLHDLGAISITNSDAMGMGRVGETIRRTWQMANRMKGLLGPSGDGPDNDRVLRYLAKYTINPAIAHGLASRIGSLEAGKLADIVLWRPGWFGVKPEVVVKSGFIAWAAIGEGNASIERAEPVMLRPMFGAQGRAAASLGVTFACGAAVEGGARADSPRPWEAVQGTRRVRKDDMVRNATRPRVAVDPARLTVRVDGEEIRSEPTRTVALNRLYLLG